MVKENNRMKGLSRNRRRGRPLIKMYDNIRKIAGKVWIGMAKDREMGTQLYEMYIQMWINNVD